MTKNKKYNLLISNTIIILSLIGFSTTALSKEENNQKVNSISLNTQNILTKSNCDNPLKVNFVADETLFTIVAWLNFVVGIHESEKHLGSFPERVNLLKHLEEIKKKNPTLYLKNLKAYQNFFEGYESHLKDGLFLMGHNFYGDAPNFVLYEPSKQNNDFDSKYIFPQLPKSDIIKDFYDNAEIHKLWLQSLDTYKNLIQNYEKDAEVVLQDLLCFTNMQQKYPVEIKFNLLGSYGVNGQTNFVNHENKFVIQINPIAEQTSEEFTHTLSVIRHEFSHSLFNEAVAKNEKLIKDKLKKFSEGTGLSNPHAIDRPAEMLAQAFQYVHYSSDIIDAKISFYFDKAFFIAHLSEQLDDFKKSKQSFAEYIPEFFRTYDAEKEIALYKELKKESDDLKNKNLKKNGQN